VCFLKGPGTGCEKVGSCDGVFGEGDGAVEGGGGAVGGGGEVFGVVCYADFGELVLHCVSMTGMATYGSSFLEEHRWRGSFGLCLLSRRRNCGAWLRCHAGS
jgi:hypothetical protein